MKEKNKICFFNSVQSWGGGEKWQYEQATALSNEGLDVLAMTNKSSELLFHFERDNKVPTFTIKTSNLSFLNPIKVWQLRRFLCRHQIDTIILNLSSDVKVAGIAAKWAGVKRIVYMRGVAIPIKNRWFNRMLFKHIITDVIANSEATKKTIIEHNPNLFPENKIEVIYHGIPPIKAIKKKITETLVLGTLGRLSSEKGQVDLIEVANILRQKGCDFRILIGGTGELEGKLKAKIQENGLNENIKLMGFVDSNTFLSKIDVFLLTSRWEGFGYVLAEAMAHEKPVIAYNVGSIPEIVKDEQTGFLIEPFNQKDFADKILYLAQEKEVMIKMGEKGRIVFERMFTFVKSIQKLKSFLNLI